MPKLKSITTKDSGRTIHDDRLAEIAWDIAKREFPDWSVDELVCHCDQAKQVCVETRLRAGKRVEDHVILKALMNARKRSILAK